MLPDFPNLSTFRFPYIYLSIGPIPQMRPISLMIEVRHLTRHRSVHELVHKLLRDGRLFDFSIFVRPAHVHLAALARHEGARRDRLVRYVDHDPVRLVDGERRTDVRGLHLHPPAVDDLACRDGRVEHHPALGAAVEDHRFQLSGDLNRHVITLVYVHLLLRVRDLDLTHAVLARIPRLVLDVPLEPPSLVLALRRAQRLLGAEFGSGGGFGRGGGLRRRRVARFFVLVPPSLLVPRHLFQSRRGGVAGLFLFELCEDAGSAAAPHRLCGRCGELRLRGAPDLPDLGLRKVLPMRVPGQPGQVVLLQVRA
mmetsp:Transcript_47841/g.101641  ORF Transcript_47841/g.101641 Transcript_47841/m.101641 type:complete len:310 (-) Transcript_47841:792-1721(-)